MWDRIFDQYVQVPMQKIVTDAIRPDAGHDPHGVAEARAALADSLPLPRRPARPAPWALGDALHPRRLLRRAGALLRRHGAAPRPRRAGLAAYLARLMRRPSFARVLADAEPYFAMFPLDPKPRLAA